jgi:hypothetical protein
MVARPERGDRKEENGEGGSCVFTNAAHAGTDSDVEKKV